MRGLKKLFLVELKLFIREPEAFFFTLIFPLIMLFVFGSIYGNEPTIFFAGRGTMDMSVPAYMGLIIAVTGLITIPVSVGNDREKGILRRLRATPIRPHIILTAWIFMYFIVTFVGAVLLVMAGKIFYNLRFDGNVLYVILGFVLSVLSFLALGFVLASLASTGRSANIIGLVLYFPMIFFSGATIPWKVLSKPIQTIGSVLPLTYVVRLLQGLWFREPLEQHILNIAVLCGMLVIGVLLSAKIFRWR